MYYCTFLPVLFRMGSTISTDDEAIEGAAGYTEPHHSQTTRTHLLNLSSAHNKFSFQLYQEFTKDGRRTGNVVLGTISASLGLGLLYVGASGRTMDDIHKALHLSEVEKDQLLPAFAAIHWDVVRSSVPKGCVFEVAIRLFVQPEITLTSHYKDLYTHYEISTLKQADFKNRPDLARKTINQWAEERTNSLVKDVIPTGQVDHDTKILVLCATYLKPHWKYPFDKRKNYDGPFYLTLKETLRVRVMCQTKIFRYAQSSKGDYEALELPFANSYMSMLIFLPHKMDGLSKLESKIDRKLFDNINKSLNEEMVEVHLPKYHYEMGLAIGEQLQKLGAKTMYQSGKADFSRITTTSRDLHLSKFFHYVSLDIEEGVASSTPSGSAGKHCIPTENEARCSSIVDGGVKVFRCDHPFLFVVRDDRTGAIYFVGRMVRPLSAL